VAEDRDVRAAVPLLHEARGAVVVHVAVRDHDAADLVEAPAQPLEAGLERGLRLGRAQAGVEHEEAAAGVLHQVGVDRPARLRERDRDGDAVDAEPLEIRLGHARTALPRAVTSTPSPSR
jgi:hypothetical protein